MEFNNHDASYFLKKYKKEWNYFANAKFNWISNNYIKEKEITCTAVPNNIDQTKYISKILKSYSKQELDKTAIVLGEESIIIPLLNSLPSNVNDVNITCLLYTSPSPRDRQKSRMPSSA